MKPSDPVETPAGPARLIAFEPDRWRDQTGRLRDEWWPLVEFPDGTRRRYPPGTVHPHHTPPRQPHPRPVSDPSPRLLTHRQLQAEIRAHHGTLLTENARLRKRVKQLEQRLALWHIRWKNRARMPSTAPSTHNQPERTHP
jgi:hypothetical protein